MLLACLMAGCIWEDEAPPYPPIDKGKLVGCWVHLHPESVGFECVERCYSSTGQYYARTNTGELPSGGQGIVEASGTYLVNGNTITRRVKRGNNIEKPDTSIIQDEDGYTVMRDTLFSTANGAQNLNPLVRADSSNSCGPHWQVFIKPEGWDLD